MDTYLARFGVAADVFYKTRRENGQFLPMYSAGYDPQYAYIYGRGTPSNYVPTPNDVFRRYVNGFDISSNLVSMIPSWCSRDRFEAGFDLAEGDRFIPKQDSIRSRFRNGRGVAIGDGAESCFKHGGEIAPSDYGKFNRECHHSRFTSGYEIPPKMIEPEWYYHRIRCGYDPEIRPPLLSYLLGYVLPPNLYRTIALTERDRAIHDNFDLNVACILALAGIPFIMLRRYSADFEYVTGLAPPSLFTLRDPLNEIVFQTDGNDRVVNHVTVNEIVPCMYHQKLGKTPVGELRGDLTLVKLPLKIGATRKRDD